MNATRFVLFDAVGTLIFPRPSVAEVYAEYGQRFGSRLTAPQIQLRFRSAFARPTKHRPISEAGERKRWRQIVREVFEGQHWALFDDVQTAWQELTQAGYKLGIASNFDARLHDVCRCLPPLDACTLRFVSSEVGFAKPDPRFFAAVAERLSASPETILLVGDDPRCDYEPALAAGWQAVQIDREAERSTAGVIRNLRELLPLLVG
jgi:putative hydrolase of the HAD superfamily